MFNNRRIPRQINPAVLEKNDIVSLTNNRSKSLEQRIIFRHESYIQALKSKVNKMEQTVKEPVVNNNDSRIEDLKNQCQIQSTLLKQYEDKLVGMVGYIKRLEEGLEKVKELLTNNTNTADTIDKIPEFDEEEPKVVEEENKEELSVEKVKEDGDVNESVSLEIVEK